jgi:Flp pilus assembly pilin Flp
MQNLIRYLRDQQGVETLEWILIGGLITGVGIALYPGVLGPGLSGVIGIIVGAITGAVTPAP